MDSVRAGERVLVTGGTGSLGQALTENLLADGAVVRIFSRDEKKQYDMRARFPECEYVIGDIKQPGSIRDAVRDVDVVIHGASLKYVNIGEIQPAEYVQTNIVGTMHLLDAILAEGTVRRAVGISSDKACLPVNTYGFTKAALERLMLECNARQGDKGGTIYNVARYGNVVGTRGSVVPFWRDRLLAGLDLPVTNPHMTRFFFTIHEAVDLIDFTLAQPAGVVVSKRMNACTVGALAEAIRGEAKVEIIGPRPGEKLHEMLLSADEMTHTRMDGDYFVLTPSSAPHDDTSEHMALHGYTSATAHQLTQPEIQALL